MLICTYRTSLALHCSAYFDAAVAMNASGKVIIFAFLSFYLLVYVSECLLLV